MYKHVFFLFLIVITLSTACQEDEPVSTSETGLGDIVVINEGKFGGADGSLSIYNVDSQRVENNVFENANSSKLSANIQSVALHQDQAFILCNVADKIEIVDASTLQRVAPPIEDTVIITPRYMTVADNKAYVSVWGPYDENYRPYDSKIAIIDLTDYTITTLNAEDGPEGILAYGNKVFVANSYSNTVSVINTQTAQIESTITLGSTGPVRLALDRNEDLWVSTGGFTNDVPHFYRIDPTTLEIEASISIEDTRATGNFTFNSSRDSLFFMSDEPYPATGTAIYAMSMTATTAPPSALINGNNFYGIGIDPNTNILYVGVVPSYETAGTVLRYRTNGTLINDFPVGIAPNGFISR